MNLGYKKHVDDILFDHGRKCGHSCVWIHIVGKSATKGMFGLVVRYFSLSFVRTFVLSFVCSFVCSFTRPFIGI